MKKFNATLIHLVVLGLIISGNWLGIDEAKNVVMFFIWALMVTNLVCAFIPSELFFKNGKSPRNYIARTLFFIEVIAIVASGDFVTGTLYLASWGIMWGKRVEFEARIPISQSTGVNGNE